MEVGYVIEEVIVTASNREQYLRGFHFYGIYGGEWASFESRPSIQLTVRVEVPLSPLSRLIPVFFKATLKGENDFRSILTYCCGQHPFLIMTTA